MLVAVLSIVIAIGVSIALKKVWNKSKPNHRTQINESFIYARPLFLRFMASLFVLILLVVPVCLRNAPVPIFWFGVLGISVFVPVFVFLAGPNEIVFDLRQHQYIARSGWPFKPVCWQGSINDIAAISVTSTGIGSTFVILRWKKSTRHNITLGMFSPQEKAKDMAEKMATLLGVPIIPLSQHICAK